MIYYIVFAFSSILFYLGTKSKQFKSMYILGAVLILAILAGARDYTVGTDVGLYGLYVFNGAKSYSSLRDLLLNYSMNIELGYAIIAYIASRLSIDPHFFFFIIALVNYGLIAKAICDYKEKISPTMAWLLYLFLYFSDTLNIMRQTLALAVFLIGFNYLKNKNYRMTAVCGAVALLFHTSAIIGVFVYISYYFIRKVNKFSLKKTLKYSGLALLVTFAIPYLLPVMLSMGVLPAFYERYLGIGTFGIAINPLIIRIIPLLLILVYTARLRREEDYQFLLIMIIMDMLIYNLSTLNGTFERISLYFGYFRIYLYSKMVTYPIVKRADTKVFLIAFFILYGSVIFYYQIIMKGGNQIYPYTSSVLGI